MKSEVLKIKPVFGIFVGAVAMTLAALPASAGVKEGGGGGGVRRDGQYLIAGTAKIRIAPLEESDIPGLSWLSDSLVNCVYTATEDRGRLFEAIVPGTHRHYFALKQLSSSLKAKLTQEYNEVFSDRLPSDETVIYAVTVGEDTYLLPEFFKLDPVSEQPAILMHEAAWVTNPDSNLRQILAVESSVNDYYQKWSSGLGCGAYSAALYDSIRIMTHDNYVGLIAAFHFDRINGRLNSFLVKSANTDWIASADAIPLTTFLGTALHSDGVIRSGELALYLRQAIATHPDVEFFKAMDRVKDLIRLGVQEVRQYSTEESSYFPSLTDPRFGWSDRTPDLIDQSILPVMDAVPANAEGYRSYRYFQHCQGVRRDNSGSMSGPVCYQDSLTFRIDQTGR